MAISFRPQIEPTVLTWAREGMSLSHEEIARACHCEAEDVASWEAGASAPTFVQLRALAEKCKRPLASLFLPEPPKVAEPPPEYRTLHSSAAKQPSYNTAFAIRTALYVQEVTARLNVALEEQDLLSLPHLQASDDCATSTTRRCRHGNNRA